VTTTNPPIGPTQGDDAASRRSRSTPSDLGAFLDQVAIPAVYDRLDQAFPEFDWVKRGGKGWVAQKWPTSFPVDANRKDPERLWVYADRPHCIIVQGRNGEAVRLLRLVAGGASDLRGDVFVDAVREMAKRGGVAFPQREWTEKELEEARRRESRRSILEAVVSHLSRNLSHWPAAVEYLTSTRGLPKDALQDLELGYYASAQALKQFLLLEGFTEEEVEEAGVVSKQWEGFAVFPWRDDRGHLLTLYGRFVGPLGSDGKTPDGRPKTLALRGDGSKGVPLYLNRAKEAKESTLVLVEGVIDAAFLQAHGDHRVVATVGAQLTSLQKEAVKRYAPHRVVVVGDPDGGGVKGNAKNAEALVGVGVRAYIAPPLPDGMDPDEYARANGMDAWRRHIAAATTAASFLAALEVEGVSPDSTDPERREAVARVVDLCGTFHGDYAALDADDAIRVAAAATGYAPEDIAEVEEVVGNRRRAEEAQRRVRAVAQGALKELEEAPWNAPAIAQRLREAAGDVVTVATRLPPYSTASMDEALARLPDGMAGGFGDLDEDVSFRPCELALVAARPAHGKTSVAIHLLHHWIAQGRRVVFFSFEEPATFLYARLLARLCAEVDPYAEAPWSASMIREHRRRRGEGAWTSNPKTLAEAVRRHDDLHHQTAFAIHYTPTFAAEDVVAAVKEAHRVRPVDAILIDYLQKIPTSRESVEGGAEQRDQRVAASARILKMAAVELEAVVVAGAQVNRESIPSGFAKDVADAVAGGSRARVEEVVRRSRPALHNLREGGSEQEADLVVALLNYAAEIPRDAAPAMFPIPDLLDIGALKNRHGRANVWSTLRFNPESNLVRRR
jgi:DNA primase